MTVLDKMQETMKGVWDSLWLYFTTMSDLIVSFLQNDLNIDSAYLASRDFKLLCSVILAFIIPVVLTYLVMVICGCLCGWCKGGRKEKSDESQFPRGRRKQFPRPYKFQFEPPLGYGDGGSPISSIDRGLEAARWMKQAEVDLNSALNDLKGDVRSPEWVCFKCQQSAEKALKACLISKDIQYVNVKNHDLCDLAKMTKDNKLTMLASSLQILIGFVGQLRYPDYLPYPKIPNDVYTQEQAERAVQTTGMLLSIVAKSYLQHGDEDGDNDDGSQVRERTPVAEATQDELQQQSDNFMDTEEEFSDGADQ